MAPTARITLDIPDGMPDSNLLWRHDPAFFELRNSRAKHGPPRNFAKVSTPTIR
jgi:hypothetical protein